jgi:8-oxo-dGTP pyrophosphatase MutT (NUDIX family)
MYLKTLNIVLCAVEHEGRLLLLKREKEPYRGYWGMPGGKIRFGETVEQAALREAKEETALPLSFNRICGVATENILSETGEVEAHFIMFIVSLRADSVDFTPGEEGELQWFPASELETDGVIPSDREMLKTFVLPGARAEVKHFTVRRNGGFALEA